MYYITFNHSSGFFVAGRCLLAAKDSKSETLAVNHFRVNKYQTPDLSLTFYATANHTILCWSHLQKYPSWLLQQSITRQEIRQPYRL